MYSRIRLTGLLLLCVLLTGCTGVQANGVPPTSGGAPPTGSVQTAAPEREPWPDPSCDPNFEPWPDPDCPPEQPAAPYDFSQPAPESAPVELDYFDDAAFVGDSRTDGFLIYSGIGRGANLTSNGLSIFALGDKKTMTVGGKDYTLLEALALKKYGKVYLSLGVNELGTYNDDGFYAAYCGAIDDIRACQPDAVLYIQGLIPLNERKVKESGGRDYLKNDHLRVYNDLMCRAASEKRVVFLDLYTAFAQDGELPYDASRDGVHLSKDYCRKWLDYLQTHTADADALYPDGQSTEVPQETQKEG